ncbi:hypothetical protein L3X39_10275 [Sabulilitoribacter multivorans]|uniref:Lipoprotein n=1 Tax=Flaviramulus multivorans TaxID=1304750 RepID=A0ABS9IK88_9FLAO|nr:hypothetical protein [Flaviramulus multivorans]MCF7561021.1 hypothetical protein [Flaviramulus multivorans]
MTKYFQLFLILLTLSACGQKENEKKRPENVNEKFLKSEQATESQNEKISDEELYLNIDFQDFFEKDKISFLINNCLVFKNEILTSDKSIGLTNIFLKIKKEDTILVVSINDKKNIKCKTKNTTLVLTILVNKVENIFTLDLNKGKYVGLEKTNNNKLVLNQSQRQFEYD